MDSSEVLPSHRPQHAAVTELSIQMDDIRRKKNNIKCLGKMLGDHMLLGQLWHWSFWSSAEEMKMKYSELAAEFKQSARRLAGPPPSTQWNARGFVGKSGIQLHMQLVWLRRAHRGPSKPPVVATEEAQFSAFNTSLGAVAGGGRETSPPGDVLHRGQNISQRWIQLTTLQLTQCAQAEVQQAKVPSRKNITVTTHRTPFFKKIFPHLVFVVV